MSLLRIALRFLCLLVSFAATGALPAFAQSSEPGCRPEMASYRLPIQRVQLAKD